MVVVWILVQDHSTKFVQRELISRPHLCDVEGIELGSLCLFRSHDLVVRGPLWEFPLSGLGVLDLVPHVLLGIVRVDTRVLLDVLERHEFLASLLLEGVFDVVSFALLVDPRERVTAVSVEVPSIRVTRVGEEHGSGVVRLWDVGEEVECGVVVDEVGLWVSTLTPDVVWTLHWLHMAVS